MMCHNPLYIACRQNLEKVKVFDFYEAFYQDILFPKLKKLSYSQIDHEVYLNLNCFPALEKISLQIKTTEDGSIYFGAKGSQSLNKLRSFKGEKIDVEDYFIQES